VTEENEEESEEDEEDDSIVEGTPISHSDERKRKRDRSWIEKAIEGKPSRYLYNIVIPCTFLVPPNTLSIKEQEIAVDVAR